MFSYNLGVGMYVRELHLKGYAMYLCPSKTPQNIQSLVFFPSSAGATADGTSIIFSL